mmetsp:Transcript_24645/g.57227  ORF Transcript_24645/g.57227 Transcript_24645/m.57227 type:complete len:94 (+) Transcript_24645:447-728(+)
MSCSFLMSFAAVISSRIANAGLCTRTRATATRCCSPRLSSSVHRLVAERSPCSRCRTCSSPTRFRIRCSSSSDGPCCTLICFADRPSVAENIG